MPKYFKGYLQKKRTTQKKKFYVKDFPGKCDQIPSFLRIFTFTGEIINGKLHFLCSDVLQKKDPSLLSVYAQWQNLHICKFNDNDTDGGMETEGTKSVFYKVY